MPHDADYEPRTGRARTDDYETSVAGAVSIGVRSLNQRGHLLAEYLDSDDGLTDEEAATRANLLGTCYWKRCGELRQDGLIERPDGAPVRRGTAGVIRIVCVITPAGRAALQAHAAAVQE